MKFSRYALTALVLMLGAASAGAANSASVDRAFSAAVARILAGVHNDFLDSLSAAEMREFVACAQRVMNAAPLGRKQYVLAATNQSEMRKRFDEVALDNRARLKQRITAECA